MTARRAALLLAAALLAPGVPRAIAADDVLCVPAAIRTAVARAERVRLVRIGPLADRRFGRHTDAPDRFMGCPRLESVEVAGPEAGALVAMLTRRGRIECTGHASGADFGGGARGAIGVEYDTPSGRVRALVMLPAGTFEVGFANGVRFPAALSRKAAADWWRFVAGFARERRAPPEDLLAFLLEGQAELPPVVPDTLAIPAPSDSGLPHR